MKHIVRVLLIVICVAVLFSCKDKETSLDDIQNTEPNMSKSNEFLSSESTAAGPADTFQIVGKVTYKNIEGGFYAIDGDNGRKYDPINLPEPFRKDGLRVKVTARRKTDVMSFHMYGTIIEVVNIAAQ